MIRFQVCFKRFEAGLDGLKTLKGTPISSFFAGKLGWKEIVKG